MRNSITQKIASLRALLIRENIDALYISGADPHAGEYLCDRWQTRRFVSGFTGSFGEVVISMHHAGLWTDSRYFLQASEQIGRTGMELHKLRVPDAEPVVKWLMANLPPGSIVGVDPFSLPLVTYREFAETLTSKNISLVFVPGLLDEIWPDRPPMPQKPIFELPDSITGESRTYKFVRILNFVRERGADLTLISALDDLAWTFNLRGNDILYNPVFLGFGIIGQNYKGLFVHMGSLPDEVRIRLLSEGITIGDYDEFYDALQKFEGNKIYIDPATTNTAIWSVIHEKCILVEGTSIPTILKSVKNSTEIEGIRLAILKDGIALVEFLHWLNSAVSNILVSEYDAGQKLFELRTLQDSFKGESFASIVGYGDHGAIVHLSVDNTNANVIKNCGLLLFDSGGQYLSGTTDVTRTVSVGEVTSRQKTDFTLVLKGMIGLSQAIFPAGTRGMHLDILARNALWQNYLNYGHGTGHGVGHFLNVHEGPASIRQELNGHEIKPGMVFSNEPGLYRTGEYGIRIENMMVCVEKQTTEFGRFLGFETLTLCPIDLKVLDVDLLSASEKTWLNDYHRMVKIKLLPLLSVELQQFLHEITPLL